MISDVNFGHNELKRVVVSTEIYFRYITSCPLLSSFKNSWGFSLLFCGSFPIYRELRLVIIDVRTLNLEF